MRTRYGSSPWIHELPSSRVPAYPRFRGDRAADVVIVGAGITGCAVAHACAAAGFQTLVLEADRVGRGGAGRGAGLMSTDPGPSFRDLVAAHGPRDARRVFEAWRRGAIAGAALLLRLRIYCQLAPRESIVIAGRDDESHLRREFDARGDAGRDLTWQTPKQLHSRMKLDAAGGVTVRGGFTLDPYRACLGLAAAAVSRGAACFEHSPVQRVRFTRRHADVITVHGTIRAGRVVIATGSATAEFKPLRRHFKRRDTYFAMTEPVPAVVRKQLCAPAVVLADLKTPPHRIRWAPGDRLIVSGADQDETNPKVRPAVIVQRTGQLMYELLTMYPAISGLRPEFGWDASYGRAADGLMYIGAHRNYPHHLFALGGSGSVTGAFVASRVLLQTLQGTSEKADEVFGWTR